MVTFRKKRSFPKLETGTFGKARSHGGVVCSNDFHPSPIWMGLAVASAEIPTVGD